MSLRQAIRRLARLVADVRQVAPNSTKGSTAPATPRMIPSATRRRAGTPRQSHRYNQAAPRMFRTREVLPPAGRIPDASPAINDRRQTPGHTPDQLRGGQGIRTPEDGLGTALTVFKPYSDLWLTSNSGGPRPAVPMLSPRRPGRLDPRRASAPPCAERLAASAMAGEWSRPCAPTRLGSMTQGREQ